MGGGGIGRKLWKETVEGENSRGNRREMEI